LRKLWDWEEEYLKEEGMMDGSAYHGIVREWYENGQQKKLGFYEHGICIKEILWDQFSEIADICILKETDSQYGILIHNRKLFTDHAELLPEEREFQEHLLADLNKTIERHG
jgi:hypothetical protein